MVNLHEPPVFAGKDYWIEIYLYKVIQHLIICLSIALAIAIDVKFC